MKLRHIIIIVVFLIFNIVVIASLNMSGGKPAEEKEEKALFIPTLKGVIVENKTEILNIGGYGTVSSFNAFDVACEVQGKLSEGKFALKPGTKFRKGDLLFRISDTDARYNLRARKSGFITIIANLLPDIKVDFPDEFTKWSTYIDDIKLNEDLPQLPSWKSSKEKIFLSTRNVLTEYFSIKGLEEQLNKYAVFAPFSGVITDVYLSNYSVVNPGTRIMRIVETDNFEIPVSIAADQLDNLKIGATASIYTTAGTLKGMGTVVRISEVINKSTQAIDVYVKPKSIEGQSFVEGEYVHVKIDQENEQTGFRVPKNAIFEEQVYTYSKQDSSLIVSPVQIVTIDDEGAFVKGLKDKSIVITQEVLNFTDTSKYQILIK
jgi:membrane fusion protein, multidrug efflux system